MFGMFSTDTRFSPVSSDQVRNRAYHKTIQQINQLLLDMPKEKVCVGIKFPGENGEANAKALESLYKRDFDTETKECEGGFALYIALKESEPCRQCEGTGKGKDYRTGEMVACGFCKGEGCHHYPPPAASESTETETPSRSE